MPTPFIVTTNEIAFEAVDYSDALVSLQIAIGKGASIKVRDANGEHASIIFNPEHVKYVGVEVES